MVSLLSKIFTFLSGVAGTVAVVGTGPNPGIPRWLTILCIALTGGFAKASYGALPLGQVVVTPPRPGDGK